MMRIDILTLFPEMFESPLGYSILRRAQEQGIVAITITNIRDFATDKYRKVDDKPYGGGPGMVMMPGPVFDCFDHVTSLAPQPGRVLLLSPQGRPFHQAKARELAREDRLILIAGRYEGFDERIRLGLGIEPPGSSSGGGCEARDGCVEREPSRVRPTPPPDETSRVTAGRSPIRAEQISIGDYVLNGGELAAMVVIDAVVRLLPGALGDEDSAKDDSFSTGLLEYPQYTRPEDFRGLKVPEILLSGDHAKIAQWRRQQALERTQSWRPDLLPHPKPE
jgi:tRNA (guanine37-N1)-methyltransferase